MSELPAGVYKHYKGGLVLVLGVARHSETDEKFVVYVPLGVKMGPRMSVRPYSMFFEDVKVGETVKPRFGFVGETVEPLVAQWYDPLSGYTGADRVND